MLGLREYFREGLTAKIEALELARHDLAGDKGDALDSIRRLAHSLRGSGTTYGFPRISEAARVVEESSAAAVSAPVDRLLEVLRESAADEPAGVSVVLVVAGDPDQSDRLQADLAGPGRKLIAASSVEHARRILEEQELDLAVIDLLLPDGDARQLLVWMRERPGTAGVPVFVLSKLASDQVKTECLALGAQQFMETPVRSEYLSAAVGATLLRERSTAERWSQDPLTGLPNRASFHDAFGRAAALASRTGQPLSVAILDLDHFKSINDEHGHTVGDEVLCSASSVIARRLRKSDVLARWGGEEFVGLFPDTTEAGAVRALQNALENLQEQRFVGREGTQFGVTFSAGVSHVGERQALPEVLARADGYLYQAKAAGRHRIYCSTSNVSVETKNILVVEDDDAVARIISCMLTTDRFEVVRCRTADEALERVDSFDVALGILDVNMPGMDGFGLLERFRAMPAFAATPIVMLTGRDSETDVLRGFDLGADDYIVKPFSAMELQARVRRLLKRG